MNGQPRTTTAERLSFAVCTGVLLILVGAICYLASQPRAPAEPTVQQTGTTRVVDGRSYVTAEVRNAGDETAQAVQVTAELTVYEDVIAEGGQTVDFLSGGESEMVVFVFDDVPRPAQVSLRVPATHSRELRCRMAAPTKGTWTTGDTAWATSLSVRGHRTRRR